MKKLRKFLNISVMVMTIAVMSGFATLAPANASAQAGDLIKMDGLSSVYYLGADGSRYVFPSESVYFSWYSDFSGVVTIPASELQTYPLGSNVTMRAGTNLVKITTDPSVYAVSADGTLRKIQSEADAIALYGSTWASMVVDVADAFFTNYTVGTPLPTGTYPAGTLLKNANNASVYYFDGTDYRMVGSDSAFTANRFEYSNIVTTTMTLTASGTAIAGMENFSAPSGTTGGTIVTGSGLTAALSSMTPASQSIPYNVHGMIYTSVNLTAANDGAIELTALNVSRTGLGDWNSFDSVYVEVDGELRGSKRTLGSDNEVDLYFSSDKIVVPAGQTITIDLVADMAGNTSFSSGNNALMIMSASALTTSGATVSGSFPITGNTMSLVEIEAPIASFDLDSDTDDVYLGDEQVEVASFDLDNDSTSETISFTEVSLENTGSADANEAINYTLYVDGDIVSGPVNADSDDSVRFILNNAIELEDGASEGFVVKADIYDGRGETIILDLDEETDVKAVGLTNGFNVVVSEASGSAPATYTIQGGDLNFTEADTNPGDTDVALEDEDVLFLAADVESYEEIITITDLTLDFDNNTSHALSVENVTLYLDGQVVAGPQDFVAAASSTIIFDEEFEVSGKQLLEVKADIADDAVVGDYVFTLESSKVSADDSEGDSVTSGNIKGSVDGATVTVGSGDVTLSEDTTYGDRTFVAGSDDLLVGQFILETSDAEGIKITDYDVDVAVVNGAGGNFDVDSITELYISEDDDVITSVSATGNTFNVNQELAAGTTTIVKVYASVDDDYTASTDTANDTVTITLNVNGEGLVSGEDFTEETQIGQTMTFEAGTLVATVSSGTADSAIVIAGTSNVEVAEFNFESDNTSYLVKDIEVTVSSVASSVTLETALVTQMTLNGETVSVINGVATFDGPIAVPQDEDIDLTVYADFNGDFNSIDSGDTANFVLTGYDYKASNENSYTTFTTTDYYTNELMYARNTVPTIMASAGDTLTLKTSNNEVMDLSITADLSDDVTIASTTVNIITNVVSATTTDTMTIEVINDSGDVVATKVITDVAEDVAFSTSGAVLSWTGEETTGSVISAGETEIYTVRVSFSVTPGTDTSLEVELVEALTWNDGEASANITTNAGLINDLSGSFEIDNK